MIARAVIALPEQAWRSPRLGQLTIVGLGSPIRMALWMAALSTARRSERSGERPHFVASGDGGIVVFGGGDESTAHVHPSAPASVAAAACSRVPIPTRDTSPASSPSADLLEDEFTRLYLREDSGGGSSREVMR